MTSHDYYEIKKMLFGVMSKANKLESLDERRRFYFDFLKRNIDFLDLEEQVDIDSSDIAELISNEFLTIETERPHLFEETGFVPWLEAAKKDITWNYYNRYEQYLMQYKNWKPTAIAKIKVSSDIILDHMANPKSPNYFDKQGLVIGDIQSGKTANYTAVINKAIDAGYKIVIVLAGMTKDLRNQTQNRLDTEVLGYETKPSGRGKTIGVGKIKQLPVEGLTYSDDVKDYGDMKKYFSTHTLDDSLNPIVAIVKKNKSVLNHLLTFLTSSQSFCYTNGKLNIPVLIIDDEVDQASVDTKDSDEAEGASAINKMIRSILDKLNRYAYVGYTATPFANVFINPERKDIYPKDFILTIPSNDGYCGIKEYFGVDIIDDEDVSCDNITDLVVNISDYNELFVGEHKISAQTATEALNESLKEAIRSFILAASIKKSRGFDKYNSMLIHIARYKNPATTLKPLVADYVATLYKDVKYHYYSAIEDFKHLWESRFEKTSKTRLGAEYKDDWKNIEKYILPTLESAMGNIKVINGDSGDMLDYSASSSGDYIVIGGDKLSRGLTLEGLVVSYYYRNSRTYDSLLQMGRWFGYRKGWIDVCRVYTMVRFINDFITVGKVMQKFKADVEDMYNLKLNPREVGQRIMYSPNLIPTARAKMKSTTKYKVSFSGQIQQVITFGREHIKHNFDVAKAFISQLKNGEIRRENKVVFKDVSADLVLDYLRDYREYSNEYGYGFISVQNWIKYIEKLVGKGELTSWTVVLHSVSPSINADCVKIASYDIYKPKRTLRDVGDSSQFKYYTIKNLSDPKDFAEFFDPKSKEYNMVKHYNPATKYPGFDAQHAIIAINVVDLYEKELTDEYNSEKMKFKAKRGRLIDDAVNTSGPTIWFPHATNYEDSAISYYVTKDYLAAEQKLIETESKEFEEEETNE